MESNPLGVTSPQVGDGSDSTFSFGFRVGSATELGVYIRNTLTGVETKTADWSVATSSLNKTNGGTITYPVSGSILSSTQEIVIRREMSREQNTNLRNLRNWDPAAVEGRFDDLYRIAIEIDEVLNRSLRVPVTTFGFDVTVPTPENGDYLLATNTDNTGLKWVSSDSGAVSGIVELATTAETTTGTLATHAVTPDGLKDATHTWGNLLTLTSGIAVTGGVVTVGTDFTIGISSGTGLLTQTTASGIADIKLNPLATTTTNNQIVTFFKGSTARTGGGTTFFNIHEPGTPNVKFSVDALSGDTAVEGDLDVAGAITIEKATPNISLIDSDGPTTANLQYSDVTKTLQLVTNDSDGNMKFYTATQDLALTLDNGQGAIFAGNIAVTSASSPEVAVTDSTNEVTGKLLANDAGVQVGSMTNGKELQIFSRNEAVLSFGYLNAATFTSSVTTVGDVNVGNDLDVVGDVAIDGVAQIGGTTPTAVNSQANELVISTNSHCGATFATTSTGATINLNFAEGSDDRLARISMNGTTNQVPVQLTIGTHVTNGYMLLQTAVGTTALTLDASQNAIFSGDISVPTKTPGSASATGTVGTIAWDASYIYICVATNTWERAAIASW